MLIDYFLFFLKIILLLHKSPQSIHLNYDLALSSPLWRVFLFIKLRRSLISFPFFWKWISRSLLFGPICSLSVLLRTLMQTNRFYFKIFDFRKILVSYPAWSCVKLWARIWCGSVEGFNSNILLYDFEKRNDQFIRAQLKDNSFSEKESKNVNVLNLFYKRYSWNDCAPLLDQPLKPTRRLWLLRVILNNLLTINHE